MATLVKVSRKRDKKIRAVRGTVALLDYDDLKRKDEILGRYIIITLGPNPNFNAPKTQHEWIKISIEDRSIFLLLFLFFSNEDNPILIYYYLVITKSKCCITKVLSITIFVFFFTIHIDTSTKRMVISIGPSFHYQGAKRIFHAPWFNIFLFVIFHIHREAKQCIKTIKQNKLHFSGEIGLGSRVYRRYPDNWSFN